MMNIVRWWMACALALQGRHDRAQGAQIFAMLPFAAKSHWNILDAVLQTLVAGGHNVTVVTPFLKNKPIANYTEVDTSRLVETGVSVPWDKIMGECSVANNLPFLSGQHRRTCDTVFASSEYWHVVESNKYDLFITELLASSCGSYVSYHLQVPQIAVFSSHAHTWYNHALGGHTNPSHVSTFHAPFAAPASFAQRIANAYDYVYSHLVYWWTDREATAVGRKYFGRDAPDADALTRNTSLVFVNGHFTVDLAKPLPPNYVDIGGIHVFNERPKPLPSDIEQFINDSPNGVIYFSFGSAIKMDTFPMRLQEAFVESLNELPYGVLWKYENKNFGNLGKNVMTREWFPQRDILNHKNVKLFISHGGLSGMYEAIDSETPVLGIPLFFDQSHNVANLVHWGAGIMLNYKTLTKDVLANAINEMMINNSKYNLNAFELSKRFKDRPKTPQEEVLYWTEYVIRHKGAHHLKSTALKLSWYQYFLVDILVTVILIAFVILIIIIFLLKIIKKKITSSMKSKKE